MNIILKLRILAAMLLVCVFTIGHNSGFAAGVVAFALGGLVIETLRPRRVAGGLYVYSGVGLADIFIPSVYGAIQPNDTPETTNFAESGVAVTNPLLQEAAQSGTRKVEVPMWNDLDSSVRPNLSDATDTLGTPGKIGTIFFDARNAYLNKGWGVADLAAELAGATKGNGSGPMGRIKNRFATYWNRQFQYRIIAICKGLLLKNVATNGGDMRYNIAAEATGSVSAATKISSDALVEACFTMGDKFDNLKAIALHSAIYKTLVKQDLITFHKNSTGTLDIPTYLGRRVIVDDGLPVRAGTTSGLVYTCILFGAGAIGYGVGSPETPAEVDRIAAGGNGGGLENIWERVTWMIHPAGWHWTDSSVAGASATEAELALAANWSRILDRKNTPMAFLDVNA